MSSFEIDIILSLRGIEAFVMDVGLCLLQQDNDKNYIKALPHWAVV